MAEFKPVNDKSLSDINDANNALWHAVKAARRGGPMPGEPGGSHPGGAAKPRRVTSGGYAQTEHGRAKRAVASAKYFHGEGSEKHKSALERLSKTKPDPPRVQLQPRKSYNIKKANANPGAGIGKPKYRSK